MSDEYFVVGFDNFINPIFGQTFLQNQGVQVDLNFNRIMFLKIFKVISHNIFF